MITGKAFIYPWWIDAAIIVLRYFLLAGAAYGVFYLWKQKTYSHLKIHPKTPAAAIIRSEVAYSLLTLAIYCVISYGVYWCSTQGYTKVYRDLNEYGYSYFFFSILLMIVLHDAYFYWTHRWMHRPGIFKLVHRQHHLSHNPTPWASFAFHPLEALISIGIIPLIIFVFPAHPLALLTFLTYMTLINVMGHLGYEVLPAKFRESRIGKWQNTATYHHLHHGKSKYNYGLYFTFWDRLMGTYKPGEK